LSRGRESIEKLYRQAGSGNFQGDVFGRGWNDALKAALVALGLETRETAEARFRELDRERDRRSLASLERINAEAVLPTEGAE
jgi:hypothetical protein